MPPGTVENNMYVYVKAGHTGTWESGYYLTKYSHDGRPFIQFFPESVWNTVDEAAARVNYLNGGTGHPSWMSNKRTVVEAVEAGGDIVAVEAVS